MLQMPNGATHGVNYKTQDFFEETQKITDKKGVDVIIDFVGRSHWHKNIASFAKDGRMTILATMSGTSLSERVMPSQPLTYFLLSGSKVDDVDIGPILYKRLRIEGSTLRSRSAEYQADLIQKYVASFRLCSAIFATYSLRQIQL